MGASVWCDRRLHARHTARLPGWIPASRSDLDGSRIGAMREAARLGEAVLGVKRGDKQLIGLIKVRPKSQKEARAKIMASRTMICRGMCRFLLDGRKF